MRVDGKIGSALDANVVLFVDQTQAQLLEPLENELRFILMTSEASFTSIDQATSDAVESDIAGLKILVTPVSYGKCVRCWHRRPVIGSHSEHPELCGRCISNVDGGGELRFHV